MCLEASVEFVDVGTVVRARKEHVDVVRVRSDVAGLTPTCLVRHVHRALGDRTIPTTTEESSRTEAHAARVPVARQAQRRIVLLRPTDVERLVGRSYRMVELRSRELLVAPLSARVVADGATAIVCYDEV